MKKLRAFTTAFTLFYDYFDYYPLHLPSLYSAYLHPPPTLYQSFNMLLICDCFLVFLESIYRRGARRWRKLYRVNGHLFQAKRFNRVSFLKPH